MRTRSRLARDQALLVTWSYHRCILNVDWKTTIYLVAIVEDVKLGLETKIWTKIWIKLETETETEIGVRAEAEAEA